jgi:hypothetical protein
MSMYAKFQDLILPSRKKRGGRHGAGLSRGRSVDAEALEDEMGESGDGGESYEAKRNLTFNDMQCRG